MDLLFSEESSRENTTGLREEQISFGINLFRMGPARSMLLLAYFFPWLWAVGSLFMLSNIPARRTLGRANLAKLALFCIIYYPFGLNTILVRLCYAFIGFLLLSGNYYRNRQRMRIEKERKDREQEMEREREREREQERRKRGFTFQQIVDHWLERGLF